MKKSILILLAGTTLLAGCNLAPKYERPAGAVPVALPQGGVYPAAPTDAQDVSRIGWRDFFLDDRLRQVIETGIANNRDLRIAAANVQQARAQYRVQRADRLPTVNATGTATYTNNLASMGGGAGSSSSDIEVYQATVGLSAFELDLFGRVRNLSRAAQEQYFASEEAQRSARISLIAEIANAWLTMASDSEQLRLSRETAKAFEETLRLTREQFRVGVGSELEVRQAETSYQGAVNDIAALETSVARDQNALNLLVGTTVPAEQLPNAFGKEPTTRDALPGDVSSEVLLRRPDVLQAEHLLIAENANIGAARAAFFPTISLTGTLGTLSTALSGLFKDGSYTYTGSPGASLPLFDFGRRSGNLEYARASQKVAVATYEKAVQTAFREVSDALAQRGRIGDQIRAQTTRAEAAGVAARLSDARFRSGVDSFLVTLDAQRTAYGAEQALVTTRLTQASNLVELYRSLGGGLADEPLHGEARNGEIDTSGAP
ncbi:MULTISPECIES: efflux transporter outer membrane subunit [Sphingomonadales]|uniref:Transporter n=1 Tax=Sphingobium baderi LL03 TaxID=1114964 RepID=T0HTZ8_9SPHN|nr:MULTISPECIES: efflux transporter outer membrane subunit [Sphingomonadaceae]EQB00994.1 transporter [Sphingobium baderi LL03]KMS51055.1 transporter [Sphingobium baderi LL03]MCF8709687.1 efflux transporter outer membrane subunit [Rhizorhapis sp. SPR117]TCM26402.1 multidrug efflux system outer membrane protein [Novosphingobium sp. ST904]